MAYNGFAYWYDAFNTEADYDRLESKIAEMLLAGGIAGGLVADLGCGTGELSLRLARRGYDMIAVDASADMLTVFREKCPKNAGEGILLLNQRLQDLDLFGTIRAAVSTFDTLNHLNEAELTQAIARVSLFLEPGGVFIFDVNTEYKHKEILASNTFQLQAGEGLFCHWGNRLDETGQYTNISMEIFKDDNCVCREEFREYIHHIDALSKILGQNNLDIAEICDGENFGKPGSKSQRLLIAAKRGQK